MVYRILKTVCVLIILWALFFFNHYGSVLTKRNSTKEKGNFIITVSYIFIIAFVLLVIFFVRKI